MMNLKKLAVLSVFLPAFVLKAGACVPSSPVNVLYLGDSLTDFDRGSNHVDRLQAGLDKAWPGKVKIQNFAIRGDYIERMMDRMNAKKKTYALDRYKGIWDLNYDWAFVSLGHNDTRTRKDTGFTVPHMSEKQLREGFSDLIALLKAKGVKRIILVSAASCNFEGIKVKTQKRLAAIKAGKMKDKPFAQFGDPKHLEAYNSLMQEFAAKDPAVEYLDIYTEMKANADKPSLFRADGVHLSQKGHELVAAAELAYLLK
jgi:lysophospholipase L1-like esterase